VSNYCIAITDATGDAWTVAVRLSPTLPSDGTVQTTGATTAGALLIALQKAVECVKNHVSANGHN
jgi:hypothetical protein